MVDHAKRTLIDDVSAAVFSQNKEGLLSGIEMKEDLSQRSEDIPEFLKEAEDEEPTVKKGQQ